MGNCTGESCPAHPNNTITNICLCESCLEPLCHECIFIHNNIHAKMGYPSQIEAYKDVRKEYKKNGKNQIRNHEEAISKELMPTSVLLKNMTREYFEGKPKNTKAAKVLENLEVWKEMCEDPETNRKISEFLKRNLKTNKEIVGKEYSHLY